MDHRKMDFNLFRDLLGWVSWETVMNDKDAHESWLVFKDNLHRG